MDILDVFYFGKTENSNKNRKLKRKSGQTSAHPDARIAWSVPYP